jgi:hypothetical protein
MENSWKEIRHKRNKKREVLMNNDTDEMIPGSNAFPLGKKTWLESALGSSRINPEYGTSLPTETSLI